MEGLLSFILEQWSTIAITVIFALVVFLVPNSKSMSSGVPKFRIGPKASSVPHERLSNRPLENSLAEGRAYHDIPDNMECNKPYIVSVALSQRCNKEIIATMLGEGEVQSKKVHLTEHMEVRLDGRNFDITSSSSKEQLVAEGAVWNFTVTPLVTGINELLIYITIKTEQSTKDMDTMVWRLKVNISPYTLLHFFKLHWKWVVGTSITFLGVIFTYLRFFGGN